MYVWSQIEDCLNSIHGCCPDGVSEATGPGFEGCDDVVVVAGCERTYYGCCPDGLTPAEGLFVKHGVINMWQGWNLTKCAEGTPDPKLTISWGPREIHGARFLHEYIMGVKMMGSSGPQALKTMGPEPKSWGIGPQVISTPDVVILLVNLRC